VVRCALRVAEMVLQMVQTVWFIQPDKPAQNACAGRFVGRLRDAGFAAQRFTSLAGARRPVEEWRREDNAVRPRRGLDDRTPAGARLTRTTRSTRMATLPTPAGFSD